MAAQSGPPRTIRVFIASPGDLAVERRAFKEVIDELNEGFGDDAGVTFQALGWEDTLATTGRRSQSVINQEIDRCDAFILAMHRRWGQEAPDAKPYSSYTEEEFHRALDLWNRNGKPEIFVFFKHIDPGQMADPGPQLLQVLKFRKQLEESRQVLYRGFSDEAEFRVEVDRHLRAYAKGELPKADAPLGKVLLPMNVLAEIEKEKAAKEQALARAEREHQYAEAALARAETLALELAERAAKAALEGRVEEARQDFANAHQGTTNLRVLDLAFEFYLRTGDILTAQELVQRRLAISGPERENAETSHALGNLGLIYQKRGELDRAEVTHEKSLAIYQKLGHQEGMAVEYGNLAFIYKTRGELDGAERMLLKAQAIHEKLDHQEGMAAVYGNLGQIKQARSELDAAEQMHLKARSIYEKLDDQEGMAGEYGDLALIYKTRGELNRAQQIHLKALAIYEKLDHQEGMAAEYGNLGLICKTRGELDGAERMLLKAQAIHEKLDHQEGMAIGYANLGSVAQLRRDTAHARELWTKARELFTKIGMPHMVKKVQGWLDELPSE
jgi:tetratricopeptide (TPR) repeat protein